MKGLKKIALVTAIAAAPFAAQAELSVLDDAAMGAVTGQAGVTIDLSANINIKEIAYEDQGFLVIDGLKLGGSTVNADGSLSALDDIRLTIDVAGEGVSVVDGEVTGDLGVDKFAKAYLPNSLKGTDKYLDLNNPTTPDDATDDTLVYEAAVWEANLAANMDAIEEDQNVTDGDLVISLRSQSGAPVDFGLTIDSVSLAKQAGNFENIGSLADHAGTTLVSDLKIFGALGPIDIVVQEEAQAGNDASAGLNVNAYFNASGSMTLPFMGTSLSFKLHNLRGDSVVKTADNSLSFAHAQVDIRVKDGYFNEDGSLAAGGTGGTKDALAVNVQDFSGDLDLTNITMGNDKSIGSLYMTDLSVTANTVIYGH